MITPVLQCFGTSKLKYTFTKATRFCTMCRSNLDSNARCFGIPTDAFDDNHEYYTENQWIRIPATSKGAVPTPLSQLVASTTFAPFSSTGPRLQRAASCLQPRAAQLGDRPGPRSNSWGWLRSLSKGVGGKGQGQEINPPTTSLA